MKTVARVYTVEAVETLATLMRTAESEQARVAACRELLDRGHGKAPQAVTDADGGSLGQLVTRVIHTFTDDVHADT